MKILATLITALLLMQSTARAEEPWRFITLADWHMAEIYVQSGKFPAVGAQNVDSLKMLKTNYGGELVMLPGDSNGGHWDTEKFIKRFNPELTPAIAEYQKAIQINPNFAQARHNLGNVYYNQSKPEESIVQYQGAITINPNYAKAHYNLGVVYKIQGKLEDAVGEYQQADR